MVRYPSPDMASLFWYFSARSRCLDFAGDSNLPPDAFEREL